MTFLKKIIDKILTKGEDLGNTAIVLPGKRPVVFIKKLLAEANYSGMLPDFYTIEELIAKIAGSVEIKGVPLWLFAYQSYRNTFADEDFSAFLKWFPTLHKDWDDMLKFTPNDVDVLQYMLDDERIKNWGEMLGEETTPRKRNLDFWRRMNVFLPKLKAELQSKNWATSGMMHKQAVEAIPDFVENTDKRWIFCGFNALTPTEKLLLRSLLQWDKAECYFQADHYYIDDEKQEAGKFLRDHLQWKEFNDSRAFNWVDDDFGQKKDIKVYEVSGNVSQAKLLPEILNGPEYSEDTAVVLLDENLLPATLDALSSQPAINITMGFPLKNLSFSNAIKKLFYIQKQLDKKSTSYYYSDVLAVLQSLPNDQQTQQTIKYFEDQLRSRNLVYLSQARLKALTADIWYADLFFKPADTQQYLSQLIAFCDRLMAQELDDILYENISHFQKAFKTIQNQLSGYEFDLKMENLEVLIAQLVNSETIDFQGEPLEGLQVMGLLETRLLNFKNIILLSVNEGKLPLGNTQNTYLPFDVRRHFNMLTFLENDSIYAYHFYRLLQGAEKVHLLYNSLSSGVNTGEKSRFITQIEMESNHMIDEIIVENPGEPVTSELLSIEKTPAVLERLDAWRSSVSASHLTSYLYDPVQFYLGYVLRTREINEIEEELSQRNYGNIVHYALQHLYEFHIGKTLTIKDLTESLKMIDESIDFAINKLNHDADFYARGMNYVHKAIARRAVESIISYDLMLVEAGHRLQIIDIERKFEDLKFDIADDLTISFKGFIDRIDRLDGQLRVIDYKTGKASNLALTFKEQEEFLFAEKNKQAVQLSIYLFYAAQEPQFANETAEAGIWSFAQIEQGVQQLTFSNGNLTEAMAGIRNLILEILDAEIPFEETVRVDFQF